MTGSDPKPWGISKQITVGNLLTFGTMVMLGVAGWYGYEKRVTALELNDAAHARQLQELVPTLARLNETISLLNQRLDDYPLHKHIVGGEIVYPNQPGAGALRPKGQ